jgi:hypothetical protein
MGRFASSAGKKDKKKNKGPKGKKARAKAKLERQWGEEPTAPTPLRPGKSRLPVADAVMKEKKVVENNFQRRRRRYQDDSSEEEDDMILCAIHTSLALLVPTGPLPATRLPPRLLP